MRAVRYAGADGAARLGRLEDEHIVDAGPAPAIGFDGSPEAWELVAGASGPQVGVDEARLLHPSVPRKLIGIGLNYRDHAEESQLDIPEVPVLFAKWPSAMVGHGDTIVVPREETRPDYEAEVAVVIGRRTYRASADAARAAVGGISAMNDVSGRRAQLETPLRQFTLGKSFDTFAPMGPCVASPDGIDLTAIDVRATVSRRGAPELEHPQPDLLDRGAHRVRLGRHDARAGRCDRHRHPGRGGRFAHPSALPARRRRGRRLGGRCGNAPEPGRVRALSRGLPAAAPGLVAPRRSRDRGRRTF